MHTNGKMSENYNNNNQSSKAYMVDRVYWIDTVVSFMRLRQQFSSKWANVSKGYIESKDFTVFLDECERLHSLTNGITDASTDNGTKIMHMSGLKSPITCRRYSAMHDMYAAASIAKPIWDKMLRVLALRIRLESHSDDGWEWFHQRVQNTANVKGALITMPIKDRERAIAKAYEDYNSCSPPILHVQDIIRSSIICVSEEQIASVIKCMYTTHNIHVIGLKNRFKTPAFTGYRDILMTVYMSFAAGAGAAEGDSDSPGISAAIDGNNDVPCGFICELQIHHIDMKNIDHSCNAIDAYQYFRTFFKTNNTTYSSTATGTDSTATAAAAVSNSITNAAATAKVMAMKLKVLKKMDQISNNVDELEQFMNDFLVSGGRVSRDFDRLDALYCLLKHVKEYAIAESIQNHLIAGLADKHNSMGLLKAVGSLGLHFRLQSRFDDALKHYLSALQMCRDIHGNISIHTAEYLLRLCDIYSCKRDFQKATPLYVEAHDIYHTIRGSHDYHTLTALQLLAENYEDVRNWVAAIATYKQLISVTIDVQGPDSREAAALLSSLGHIQEMDEQFLQAVDCYQRARDIYAAHAGSGDVATTTAAAMIAMANVYDRMGLYHKALLIYKDICCPEGTLSSVSQELLADIYCSIGRILIDTGDVVEAKKYLEKNFTIREYFASTVGDVSSLLHYATAMSALAQILCHFTDGPEGVGNLNRAGMLLDSAFSLRGKYYGTKHIACQETLRLQAIVRDLVQYQRIRSFSKVNRGRTRAASTVLEEEASPTAVTEQLDFDDDATVSTATSTDVTSVVTATTATYTVTIDKSVEEEGEKDVDETLDPNNNTSVPVAPVAPAEVPLGGGLGVLNMINRGPNDMMSAFQIDSTLSHANEAINEIIELRDRSNFTKAFKVYDEVVLLLQGLKIYSSGHVIHSILLSNYGCLLEDSGRYVEAEAAFVGVLSSLMDTYGSTIAHSYIALAYSNLGSVQYMQKKYVEALDNYTKGRDMWLELHEMKLMASQLKLDQGESVDSICKHESLMVSSTSLCIGQCMVGLGNYEEAFAYLNESYDIREGFIGLNNPDTSASLNSLAICMILLGKVRDGLVLAEKVLKVRDKICGQKHQAYSTILNNVAVTYSIFGDGSKAGRLYGYALDIRIVAVGSASEDMVTILNNYNHLLKLQRNMNDSSIDSTIGNIDKFIAIIRNYLTLS